MLPYLPDIICLSETKIKTSVLTNLSLPEYQLLMHVNSQTNAGGVGVFVSDILKVSLIDKNVLNFDCEDVWLQISNYDTSETFILGSNLSPATPRET